MLHPRTELRFVNAEIGHGIFATSFIPKGTITWVSDGLDQIIDKNKLVELPDTTRENLLKYSYRNKNGDFYFCWDNTRYVNHSFAPNSMLTTLGFEIAIKDIQIGDEMTNDYGTFNIIESFKCAHHPQHERDYVFPDDLKRFYLLWDEQILRAFKKIKDVNQELEAFLTAEQKENIFQIYLDEKKMPSVLGNLYKN